MNNTYIQFEQLVFVLVCAMIFTATAYILGGDSCMAPSPCTCGSSYIYCKSMSLTDIPYLGYMTTNKYTPTFYIYLYNNQIHSIPANVFQNFSSVNSSSIHLRLDDNMINSINPLAFTGIENKITYLMLKDNELTSLPAALGKLHWLETLHLEGNPLTSIEASVMVHFSSHLTSLTFDMGNFSSARWPAGLSKLDHLQTLVVRYIPLIHLPLDAFAGVESGLTSLTLSYSKLSRIPAAVCHLQDLRVLTFDNNVALESNSSIFEPCSHNLTSLATLALRNDNLYSFPDVLQYFPSIKSIVLDNNKIRFIPTNVIPYVNSLQTLSLDNNVLIKIPFALNKLKQLLNLQLSYNQITTVEDHDLVGLTNLEYLDLKHNPTEYIAPDAFSRNANLSGLIVAETKLQLIPEAVRSLTRFPFLDFESNNVDCSCKMSYLKGWNVTDVIIIGKCAYQQKQIQQFLLTDLPNCP